MASVARCGTHGQKEPLPLCRTMSPIPTTPGRVSSLLLGGPVQNETAQEGVWGNSRKRNPDGQQAGKDGTMEPTISRTAEIFVGT